LDCLRASFRWLRDKKRQSTIFGAKRRQLVRLESRFVTARSRQDGESSKMAMPRREFLQRAGRAGAGLAVLDQAGRLVGGAPWSTSSARAAGASNPPVALRFRQVHLDFHTSADVPDVAAAFDPDAFADTLKGAHVDSVTCFARCHHGYVYYDTKKNPERKHPQLKRPRLLEE
jgi:hypothetical protein